ncbi:hypothetical protein PInf_006707 [Phytophthora infestans]|nr:hypothetical protein PInf_006707 [Phytophthora infestans]
MMEADGVKDELAAMQLGESEDVNMADVDATDVGVVTLDKVSLLQESVDKMALSMFNALRLLPAATGDDAKKQETKDAVRTLGDEFKDSLEADSLLCGQITTLANDVLKMVQETDALIDDLPGLDKTEAEQTEELRRLQIESEEEAQTLRQVAEEAERWMNRARDSLRVISETRLRR